MTSKKMSQIRKQMAKLEREAEKLRKTAVREVMHQIRQLMDQYGINLEDIRANLVPEKKAARSVAGKRGVSTPGAAKATRSPATKKKGTRAKPQPKYCSPTDRALTWTGRGRTPRWVKEWVDSGKSLDDLLIGRQRG